jgi:hypothetical protein
MSYTQITKPTQGDPTQKSTIDALIDNDAYFQGIISSLTGFSVPNGSFELDSDADGTPDSWMFVRSGNAGTYVISGTGLADTNCTHGRRAINITSPGGATNGGYEMTTEDYIECSPNSPVILSFEHFSTVANIYNKVEILYYDGSQIAVAPETLYNNITTNPTSWKAFVFFSAPPTTARYMKVRITGAGNTSTVAGSAYFDNVQLIQPRFNNRTEIIGPLASNGAGGFRWRATSTLALIECFGAGGGGGGGDATHAASGGGAGGYCWALVNTTIGNSYAFTLGVAGAGAAIDAAGSAGTATTMVLGAVSLSAGGGGGAQRGALGSTAGTGGVAAGGNINADGNAGGVRSGTTGGDGGYHPRLGFYAVGDTGAGGDSYGPCGGGAGGGFNLAGGSGSAGRIIISS